MGMEPTSRSWCISVVVALVCGISTWPQAHSALAPENEIPLRPTTWLLEGRVSDITLPKGRTRRLYFVLKKKAAIMSVTVSPCDLPIEWSLAARSLKDKPLKSLEWSAKKSMPEVWWHGHGSEQTIHSYKGNAMDTYMGPSYAPASIYILKLHSKDQDTSATVYLHEGPGSSGAFPVLPPDPRLHTLGVGMTSVTLSWVHSPSLAKHTQERYDYCVLANTKRNYSSLCAARADGNRERDKDRKRQKKRKQKKRKEAAWPMLRGWWWGQRGPRKPPATPAPPADDPRCVCRGAENICTISELLPDVQYYFDVFVIDRMNGTSAAYAGTSARTHEEVRPGVVPLREGELRWVTFRNGGNGDSTSEQLFSFRPRGPQPSGLLTLQSCGGGQEIMVTVSSKGRVLTSQAVGEDLAQIWFQGSPSYLIHLERQGPAKASASAMDLAEALRASVKIQTSSAYHHRMAPAMPSTLQVKSFNRLRSCNAVTLAWMGTEERSLYCVYSRRLGRSEGKATGAYSAPTAPCLGPESRSDTERVLCKYYQELNPRKAVTTAVISGLDPGAAYVFDVYLMRRWGIPIKYASKTVRTRREC